MWNSHNFSQIELSTLVKTNARAQHRFYQCNTPRDFECRLDSFWPQGIHQKKVMSDEDTPESLHSQHGLDWPSIDVSRQS